MRHKGGSEGQRQSKRRRKGPLPSAEEQARYERLLEMLMSRAMLTAQRSESRRFDTSGNHSLWVAFEAQARSELCELVQTYDEEVRNILSRTIADAITPAGVAFLARFITGTPQDEDENDMTWSSVMRNADRKALANHLLELLREVAAGRRPEPVDVTTPADVRDPDDEKKEAPAAPPAEPGIREKAAAVWANAPDVLRGGSKDLPPLFCLALEAASDDAQKRQVLQAVERVVSSAQGTGGKVSKTAKITEVVQSADPGLFFTHMRRPAGETVVAENGEVRDGFLLRVLGRLQTLCPGRGPQVEELVLFIVRRLGGDRDARYPLLWGPPATGKTYILELVADVLTEEGLPARAVFQAMTQSGHSLQNPEIQMSLQGTSSHWGDGKAGMVFEEAARPEVRTILLTLDEVDKCSLSDYLVTLLDPRSPLQDNFIKEFLPSVDMRYKTLFFATANSLAALTARDNSALWSRISPIEMPQYTRPEMVELVAGLVTGRVDGVKRERVAELVEEVLGDCKSLPSVREVIDWVSRRCWQQKYDFLRGVDPSAGPRTRQRLGFV